jgi:hypothetical protein
MVYICILLNFFKYAFEDDNWQCINCCFMRYQIVHLRLAYFRTSQMQLSELIFSFTHTISFNRYKYHAWLMLLLHAYTASSRRAANNSDNE